MKAKRAKPVKAWSLKNDRSGKLVYFAEAAKKYLPDLGGFTPVRVTLTELPRKPRSKR